VPAAEDLAPSSDNFPEGQRYLVVGWKSCRAAQNDLCSCIFFVSEAQLPLRSEANLLVRKSWTNIALQAQDWNFPASFLASLQAEVMLAFARCRPLFLRLSFA
jgi:hypothetical protein